MERGSTDVETEEESQDRVEVAVEEGLWEGLVGPRRGL